MTATKKHDAIVDRRYDFVFLFDVQDGNPNGDPDAGNLPRLDPQTQQGYVTDVCIKRKVRDAVASFCDAKDVKSVGGRGIEIYMKHQGILANEQRRAFVAIEAEPSASPNLKARAWMCQNFFDVRAFGAVMTTGKTGDDATAQKEGKRKWNCGQVRGPVQITFARSIDPIVPFEVPITRVALTNPGDTNVATSIDAETGEEKAGSGQFGRKSTVPYALYRGHGFINPLLAKDTGFTFGDLRLFFESMVRMFDLDRSASRGLMASARSWSSSTPAPWATRQLTSCLIASSCRNSAQKIRPASLQTIQSRPSITACRRASLSTNCLSNSTNWSHHWHEYRNSRRRPDSDSLPQRLAVLRAAGGAASERADLEG